MKVQSKYLGEVEVSDDRIIHFESGLPAFEDKKQFVILPFGDEAPFFILQSIDEVEIAFVIVNPFDFFNEYQVKLPDSTIEMLEIEKEEDVAIFAMLTVQEPFANTTANLQAPVVINAKKQKGKQVVLSDSGYKTKHQLMPVTASSSQEGR
ncbi:flagellar assembly protein FliW [Desertibacillus haloalkaliphilus]|uniref:flagellar assembly protein FliW n=1 Tax=Desertibacillus haloalkaliphilus TaxID=1328930 RepID=UPI001C280655|nr:flagellar assembly protein FliW [Desertibacillus haloalkaliphilus]MBU8905989.1 flagellar assembly protein FliW [Desertibacillus haloalkaliphilus]